MLIRTSSVQVTKLYYFHQRGEGLKPIESPAGYRPVYPSHKTPEGSEEVDLGIANYPPGVMRRTGPLNALLLFAVIIME